MFFFIQPFIAKIIEVMKLLLMHFIVFGFMTNVNSFFFTDWLSDVASSVYNSVEDTGCYYIGCCNRKWKREDFSDLHNALQRNVFGQNIMIDIVVPALQGHLLPEAPRDKALTLSFHGRPGIGKNFVTTFIENLLFHKASRSRNKHVHFFTGRIHFPLEQHVPFYRVHLSSWIRGNVSKCENSLFIFDEVDKMPPGVLDAVTPFIDHHHLIDGIDYRKAIFIFISNTGGDLIAKQFLKYWKEGKKRENLRLADFEDPIRIGAFNEKGGLFRSETIESSLIDHYIPFLPLEESHVRKCISTEFKKRSYRASEYLVQQIMEDLTFGPEEAPIFSNSGCKRIASKVAAIVERRNFQHSKQEL